MSEKRVKRILGNVQDYKITFGSENGKRVLWDLMKKNGLLADLFSQESSHVSAYNEGRRAVVLYILQKMNTDIQQLQTMIERGEENENELRRDGDG